MSVIWHWVPAMIVCAVLFISGEVMVVVYRIHQRRERRARAAGSHLPIEQPSESKP